MRLEFSPSARADILEIVSVIGLDHPRAAIRWRRELHTRLEVLRTWPHAGRIVPELENPAIREIILRNYRAIYRLAPDRVEVFMVVHARRELSSMIRESEAEYSSTPVG